jgi:predicted porin
MKKTQVALAALALMASTAALAAEVKISGQIDVGVFNTGSNKDVEATPTTAAGTSGGGTYMEQGGMLDHSSITLSVNEDLGSGLKVGAVLETGFNANGAIDNGGNQGQRNALFNRQSYMYVGGDFGTIGLGKQLSPYILSMALTNGGFGTFWVPRLAVGGAGAFAGGGVGVNGVGFFQNNAVTYTSPSIGGFTITGLVTTPSGTQWNVLNEDRAAQKGDSYNSWSVSGNVGDIFVSAAWQKRGGSLSDDVPVNAVSNPNGGTTGYKSWMVGATVPLMAGLSAFGSYDSHKAQGAADSINSYGLGLKYMLTDATALQGGYAANDQSGTAERSLTNVALIHSLSKRTSLYATAGRGKNVGSAVGNFGSNYAGTTNNTYGVGVAHSF